MYEKVIIKLGNVLKTRQTIYILNIKFSNTKIKIVFKFLYYVKTVKKYKVNIYL